MRLEESNIDPTKLYFHGTSGKIEKLKAPSAEKPFFVCSDIDYAYAYSKAGQLIQSWSSAIRLRKSKVNT